jgi:colanic acid biosynthesis glycosyl transferase WcaI
LRIVLHDYSGHPFQVQLSRELAARGHEVWHWYASFFQTPHGRLEVGPADSKGLHIEGIALGQTFKKYNFLRRRAQERRYGQLVSERIIALTPDVVIASNTPLDALAEISDACKHLQIPWVFWVQDLYGIAIRRLLGHRYPAIGHAVGWYYEHVEARLLRRAAHTVQITEDFSSWVHQAGVRKEKTVVIPNWAPLDEIPLLPRGNKWTEERGLIDKRVLLYSGTLGLKHNPEFLTRLAEHFSAQPDVRVVVISEGLGANWLTRKKTELGLKNLVLLPFQPFDRMPEVLASADVLLTLLEPEAGIFSVPSKVLTYFCAARPVLIAAPSENLATRMVTREQAGLTCPPRDINMWLLQAERLMGDSALRQDMGNKARTYAEQNFNIAVIGERFDALLKNVSANR